MGLRTHEKRPLFLSHTRRLRDLAKPLNTAASYYEMSLVVKPDLRLRATFRFRVARAKQTARKGASNVPLVRDFQGWKVWSDSGLTLYPKWKGFLQANQTLAVKCGTLYEGILLTHLLPGCVISQLGETSSQPVVWGLCRETRETTVFCAPGEGTATWKMFKYYLQESSYRTGFAIRHLKNEKETVMILAIASHFRCYCYHDDDLRYMFFFH